MQRRMIPILMSLLLAALAAGSAEAAGRSFVAYLSGEESQTDDMALGKARFLFNRTFTECRYELIVGNSSSITAAHIHLGKAGRNGPVIAPLFDGLPLDGHFDGILAQGTITPMDLIGTPFETDGLRLLAAAMEAGVLYVNIHTTLYPAGAIRGQTSRWAGLPVRAPGVIE